ncbi:MAG: AAA family ATPase [Muribaculaceae bacterium]
MENKTLKRLPVGIQTYEKMVESGCLYIDKTEYIYKMVNYSNYIFLSRPRRFGKSLLVSTLQAYFGGKKELFKGLYIDSVEKDWTEYPVLKFSLASAKHTDVEQLKRFLSTMLEREEKKWGITTPKIDPNDRLHELILTAHEQTGKQVVVLIDEYDAPLLDVSHQGALLSEMRQVMRNFYSPLKDCDPYLRFVFITGITKFSQLSIFSELNNLRNISMLPEYAAICGITEDEIRTQMSDYLDVFARARNKTREEVLSALKRQYDGYHFAMPSPDIFNPFSLLNALLDKAIKSYWFESGTPTFLIEKLKEFNVLPSMLKPTMTMASAFDAPTESMTSVIPLLYQSGYFTIKDYNEPADLYTLDIPNQEIRIGLMQSLLPNYVQIDTYKGVTTVAEMYLALLKDDLDEMLRLLQAYLLTVPQCDNTNYEGHYQQLLYVIFSLLGRYVDVEVRTSNGRVDMVMDSGKALYLFELKLNKSAEAAMNQINLKDYPSRFALSGLPIVKVGINFDLERHTLEDWKIEV